MWFTALAALALQVAAPPPSAEAEQLGKRLAAAGGLAAMIPLVIEKDLAELAAEQPDLGEKERSLLLELGRAEGSRNLDRLVTEMGRAYATRLTIEDLRILVTQIEQPATARLNAIQPAVIMESMAALGSVDLKKLTAAALCKQTGKMCDRP